MAAEQIVDAEIAQLYAHVLVAVARAEGHVGPEVGHRLQHQIAERCRVPIALDDLLLGEPVEPERLAEIVHGARDPFRHAGMHPGQLGAMIVTDGANVALAKGYISEAEAQQIVRFATALGLSLDEVRRLCRHLSPIV